MNYEITTASRYLIVDSLLAASRIYTSIRLPTDVKFNESQLEKGQS